RLGPSVESPGGRDAAFSMQHCSFFDVHPWSKQRALRYVAEMKRKSMEPVSSATKKQPRQDPVSCESCRKKKLKCDRSFPCSSCIARRLDCSYGSYGPPVLNSANGGNQADEEQLGNHMASEPRPGPGTRPPNPNAEGRNTNESFLTADWLETIVMGHRVPSAVPAPLREELSHQQQLENASPSQGALPSNPWATMRSGHVALRENPMTIYLPTYLPPKQEALGLFRFYCDYLDFQYHITIASRVEQQINGIYDGIARHEPINLHHMALLFSIIASALYYKLLIEASESADVCSRETVFLTGAALIQSNHVSYPSIEGLQATIIVGHHLSNMNLHPSVSALFTHGSLVSQAKSLGLHLIDCPRHAEERMAKGFDKTDVELKRRLWWDLASYDWLLGFLSGPQELTYTIDPRHMNVREILNVEDDAIKDSENGVSVSTPTCMSYSITRLELAVVCREIVDATAPEHLRGQEIPYEKILYLDRRLHQAYAAVPSFFRFDQASRREYADLYRERPALSWQRAIVQQAYHSRFCRLHRQYFVRGAKDPRYSYSHVVSLQSARKVLEVKRIMDEQEPRFVPCSSVVWAIMHHVFMAAVILLIDVCFNWDDILAEKRKEEVLDACRTLSRAQQSSAIAREGINAMMGILRRHWKQQRRPVSHGLNADTTGPAGLDLVTFGEQHTVPPATNLSGLKDVPLTQQPSNTPPPSNPSVPPNHEPSPTQLEDLWTEMLDSRAHADLGTPDWTDLLTELTNLPCE
ncbi:hypothetical protein NUU61_003628, partial [Penicillium alfredii]